ncbi:testosterone 17-beta-dehydrogenase 3 [Alosa sapidissima]|uniref:testosterone 17-beta-dehydrogenase 3 n=1 Tax=Alosa sapidissima TaxID=34773 RepID=UPI001C096EC0|nr:testosterone 17-beta-dehydrogenase 3 [Alosa sapidissima]
MDSSELVFTVLGAGVAFYYILKTVRLLKVLFPKFWYTLPGDFFTSMGEWAVITGGSDGIGKAYALELAQRGMNVVIVSRSIEKLNNAAKEIGKATGKRVKVLAVDFTKDHVCESIEKSLEDLNIGVLVNNVGMLPSPLPCKFLDMTTLEQTLNDVVNCNTKSMMQMCRIVLPGMEERGKGVILNVSSGMAAIPFPTYTLYTASKACVETFSQGLQAEYKAKGIIIQTVCPFGISTNMTGYQKPDLITYTPEDFVKTSLAYLKAGDKTFGSIAHTIMGWIIQTVPIQYFQTEKMQEQLIEFVKGRTGIKT